MKLLMTVLLFVIGLPQVSATNYLITTGVDGVANDGNCTLREALLAADTQSAVDECPAGTADNTITLDNSVVVFFFIQGEMEITNPQNLTINSLDISEDPPTINMLNANRFIAAELAGFNLTITGVNFFQGRDTSGEGGGVLWIDSGNEASDLTVTNVQFLSSTAVAADGGAVLFSGSGYAFFRRVLFQNNTADAGSGMSLNIRESSAFNVINEIEFINNDSKNGRGALNISINGGFLLVTGVEVVDNLASGGNDVAGIYIETINDVFSNNINLFGLTIEENEGAGIFVNNSKGNVVFDGAILKNNFKVGGLGSNQINVNSSTTTGQTLLSNILAYQSITQQGVGMVIRVDDENSEVSVRHATIVNHVAGIVGSGVPNPQSVDLRNSIVYDNVNNLFNFDFDNDSLIGVDPLFTDVANEDFTLTATSPAVDAVSLTSVIDRINFDINLNPRIYNDLPDMGAYELQGPINVNLTFLGTGAGAVAYNFDGVLIDTCASDCSFIMQSTESLSLRPTANSGSIFDAWGQDCQFQSLGRCFIFKSGTDINVSVQFIDESEIIFNNGFEELVP